MLHNNFLALIATLAAMLVWLRLNDLMAHRGWISSHMSRKIIHIGTGPLFVLTWLLFTPAVVASRYLAALVPFLITLQFAMVGLGIMKDQAAVDAMSRTGDRREILRGPLYYGIVFVLLTIIFWLDRPIGIIALMMLCGGDGLAEILGRRWGKSKIFKNSNKSWVGSLSFFFGGWILSIFVMAVFIAAGVFKMSLVSLLLPLALIAAVSTLVEAVSPQDTDNITVPLAAVILGFLLL
jgi:phytol kinase